MRSPNRLVGIIAGGAYLLVGIFGFAVTWGKDFFTSDGGQLLGILGTNSFLAVVHILIGAALLLAALSAARAARIANSAVGAACLVLGLVGLFLVGSTVNVLALNVADNVLHFGTAAVLLAVGLGAEQSTTPASA